MRTKFLVIIFITLTFQSFAQNDMETECIKRIKGFSTGINFPRFDRQIIISKDTIRFDSSSIIIKSSNPDFIKIFELGLVFPDLIYGASEMGDKYEFRKTFSADTLSISSLSELHFPNQRPEIKSFSFLLWEKNMANPILYLFELNNENADSKSTIKAFLKKAKVTAFGFCSILI